MLINYLRKKYFIKLQSQNKRMYFNKLFLIKLFSLCFLLLISTSLCAQDNKSKVKGKVSQINSNKPSLVSGQNVEKGPNMKKAQPVKVIVNSQSLNVKSKPKKEKKKEKVLKYGKNKKNV